jgi:NAD(P)-dependent dehydrogenase (short-subunit alcohol dehydrogenase family)
MKETWLVTGSSVGLGRSIVEAALAEGHNVVATGLATLGRWTIWHHSFLTSCSHSGWK